MSVTLAQIICFKINVILTFQCTINYFFPIIPLNYYYAHTFQSIIMENASIDNKAILVKVSCFWTTLLHFLIYV